MFWNLGIISTLEIKLYGLGSRIGDMVNIEIVTFNYYIKYPTQFLGSAC